LQTGATHDDPFHTGKLAGQAQEIPSDCNTWLLGQVFAMQLGSPIKSCVKLVPLGHTGSLLTQWAILLPAKVQCLPTGQPESVGKVMHPITVGVSEQSVSFISMVSLPAGLQLDVSNVRPSVILPEGHSFVRIGNFLPV
jgi:hypothetical protein